MLASKSYLPLSYMYAADILRHQTPFAVYMLLRRFFYTNDEEALKEAIYNLGAGISTAAVPIQAVLAAAAIPIGDEWLDLVYCGVNVLEYLTCNVYKLREYYEAIAEDKEE